MTYGDFMSWNEQEKRKKKLESYRKAQVIRGDKEKIKRESEYQKNKDTEARRSKATKAVGRFCWG